MVIEPALFYANPQTMETNSYQHKDEADKGSIHAKALAEFRIFRDMLVERGVAITTAKGMDDSPDDIFCNWVSTHLTPQGKPRMVLYPMLNQNRQIERRPHLVKLLKKTYKDVQDFSAHEQHGKALEATGALCLDRVNRVAYHARSLRSDDQLAQMWCKMNDFELHSFNTDYKGKPVYHTDVVMWIGTKVAGVCSECLEDRSVIEKLSQTHEIVEFSNAQMEDFCGNSLQVIGYPDGDKPEEMLVMSASGFNALDEGQISKLREYYKTIITPDIPTIEYYGGGSARCMMLELF